MRLLVHRIAGVLIVAAVVMATPSTASAIDDKVCNGITASGFSCTFKPNTAYAYQFSIYFHGSLRGSVSIARAYYSSNAWDLMVCDSSDTHGPPQARIDPGDGRVLAYPAVRNGCRIYEKKGYNVRKFRVAWVGHTTEWKPPPPLF